MKLKFFKFSHLMSAFRFIKRNFTDLKVVAAPLLTVTFLFFAFTGFLMHEELNPIFVYLSRAVTLMFAAALLLYCAYDLFKSIFITPFKNIINREKGK